MKIDDKIDEYYNLFRGLPNNNPIVRNNQKNDAFEILVYDLLFHKKKYSDDLSVNNIEDIIRWIVPPPDGTIDIFYEEDDKGDFKYHIVQVKKSVLPEAEIKQCFANMHRAIKDYINNRTSVTKNLRQIISETSFAEENIDDCIYYVVHYGYQNTILGKKENEIIITSSHLETICNSVIDYCVPDYVLQTDHKVNYVVYSDPEKEYSAYQVNLNAYDLANLCNEYDKSEIGRNILFGYNFREAISKNSKTFPGMCDTIDNEPTNFWYYNNGITIIAKEIDLKEEDGNGKDFLKLTNFSIINGAQTTSTFGKYLNDAQRDGNMSRIDNLKKVFVAARIVETKENIELRKNIALYNNVQNPITSRDMVSNNIEQRLIQEKFLVGPKPNIFIEIRRGEKPPRDKAFEKHQKTSNDELAQLVFASFLASPFTSKDRKNSLFNRETVEYGINNEYNQIFNYSPEEPSKQGVLFKKTKNEINELLFIKYLHNKAKKHLKDFYVSSIEVEEKRLGEQDTDELRRRTAVQRLESFKKLKQINNINTFYNIALYYELKRQYDDQAREYNYDSFYSKENDYDKNLIKAFADLFSKLTIDIIRELGFQDPTKFVRAKNSQEQFFKELNEKLTLNDEWKTKYERFIAEFKRIVAE